MTASRRPDSPVQLYRFPSQHRALPVVQGNDDCVVALRALGEDTRARIVGLLLDEPRDVNDISKRLGVSPYNVSKHLRVLREAGLLEVAKAGRQRLYALRDTIRKQAEAGNVLDLGCCSFTFATGGSPPDKPARPPRKRATSSSPRLTR